MTTATDAASGLPLGTLCGASGNAFVFHSITVRLPAIAASIAAERAPDTPGSGADAFVAGLADGAAHGARLPVPCSAWGARHCGAHSVDGTWLTVPWFHVEHCFYAHIRAATCHQFGHDPFAPHKADALAAGLPWLESVVAELDPAAWLDAAPRAAAALPALLLLSLWGNRADLSLSGGDAAAAAASADADAGDDSRVLVDDRAAWLDALASAVPGTVAIIVDNCGHELLADIVLALGLLASGVATAVTLYVKSGPVFVSDATECDVAVHLAAVANVAALAPLVAAHADAIAVVANDFFVSPLPFSDLAGEDPALAAALAATTGIVLKGDANYRRLLGDVGRDPTTPVADVYGAFAWAPLLALRTCKSPIAVGLDPAVVAAAAAANTEWCVDGSRGMAQYTPRAAPPSHAPVAYDDVPIEVWCAVMDFVDWPSRIAAGLTCSLLRAAAHDVLFWRPLVKMYFPRAILATGPDADSFPLQFAKRVAASAQPRDSLVLCRTAETLVAHPLFIAPVAYDHALTLLRRSIDTNTNAVLWAAAHGADAPLSLLLRYNDSPLRRVDANNKTPLILAAAHGHLSTVKLLLDAGAHPAADPSQAGRTAMYHALNNKPYDVADMLLAADDDNELLSPEMAYESALRAVRIANNGLLRFILVRRPATASLVHPDQHSLVTAAIESASPRILRTVLSLSAPLDVNLPAFRTPLAAALFAANLPLVLTLVDTYGATVPACSGLLPRLGSSQFSDPVATPAGPIAFAACSGSSSAIRIAWLLALRHALAAPTFEPTNIPVPSPAALRSMLALPTADADVAAAAAAAHAALCADPALLAITSDLDAAVGDAFERLYSSPPVDIAWGDGLSKDLGALLCGTTPPSSRALYAAVVAGDMAGAVALAAAGADPSGTVQNTTPLVKLLWNRPFTTASTVAVLAGVDLTYPGALRPNVADAALAVVSSGCAHGYDVFGAGNMAMAVTCPDVLDAMAACARDRDTVDSFVAAALERHTSVGFVRAAGTLNLNALHIAALFCRPRALTTLLDFPALAAAASEDLPTLLWLSLGQPLARHSDTASDLAATAAVLFALAPAAAAGGFPWTPAVPAFAATWSVTKRVAAAAAALDLALTPLALAATSLLPAAVDAVVAAAQPAALAPDPAVLMFVVRFVSDLPQQHREIMRPLRRRALAVLGALVNALGPTPELVADAAAAMDEAGTWGDGPDILRALGAA